MVLDGGKIVCFLTCHLYSESLTLNILLTNLPFQIEFDSPQELLQKKGGAFKGLVDGSSDKKALYTIVERKVVN